MELLEVNGHRFWVYMISMPAKEWISREDRSDEDFLDKVSGCVNPWSRLTIGITNLGDTPLVAIAVHRGYERTPHALFRYVPYSKKEGRIRIMNSLKTHMEGEPDHKVFSLGAGSISSYSDLVSYVEDIARDKWYTLTVIEHAIERQKLLVKKLDLQEV